MSEHGHSMADLARVVCTHGHPDHAGGARELALAGVPVLIHPADGERLAITWREMLRQPSRGKFFAAMTPEPPETVPMRMATSCPMLGGLRVVHTPGHTPAACASTGRVTASCSWATPSSAASAACRSRAACTATTSPWRAARVQRLASLDVETVVFSHYPPLTEGASETLASLARRLD